MPAILGANSTSGYEIKNSLRFEDGDEASLTKTFSSAGNQRTWSFSCWFKRAKLPDDTDNITNKDAFFCAVNNDNILRIADDHLQFYLYDGSADYGYITNAEVSDQSAWYHVLFVLDTTNSTANQRMRVYLNGTEVGNSRYQDYADPPEDFQGLFTSAGAHSVGRGISNQESDLYLADVNYVDGTALTPTSFAETDDNGNWIPIKYTGSYGTNGFFMEFKQTGTSADASGKGADTSGNGNHFDDNNLVALDVTKDTPTNNFATLNAVNMGANTVLKEGSLLVNNADNHATIFPTIMPTSGKWYFEAKMTVNAVLGLGFRTDTNKVETAYSDESNKYYFYLNNDNAYRIVEAANTALGANLNNTSSTFQVAIDFDAAKYYFGRDDTWYAADWGTDGDPASGANPSYDLTDGTSIFPFIMVAGGTWAVNFGNPVVAISSGNADANGHGNFEFAPPSGFFALCTKNLAEHG